MGRRTEEEYANQPLHGSKKAGAWLLGFFFLLLGIAIIAGYQIYWIRVVIPQRNRIATAVSVNDEKLNPQNDGKLVHVVGQLAGAENLVDPEFGVAVDALRLRRRVWLYQWQEGSRQSQSSYGTVDSKGNTTTYLKTNTYFYSQNWFENIIDSRSFRNAGHDNPREKKIHDRTVAAGKITLGVFVIAPELVVQIDNFQTLPVSDKNISAITEPLRAQAKIEGDEIYFGNSYNQPSIGDLKVKLESVPLAKVTIIARQNGNILSSYDVPNVGPVALLRVGAYSVPEMTAQFAKTNARQGIIVWVAGCFLILFGGLLIKMARRK